MEYFKLNGLADWSPVVSDEKILFTAREARKVQVSFISDGPVAVWAHDEKLKEPRLVAYAEGAFDVEYIAEGTSLVRPVFDEQAGISCFIKAKARNQQLAARDLNVFTDIQPRAARNTEVTQMMRIMQANMESRIAAIQAESNAKIAALSVQQKTEPEKTAVPGEQKSTEEVKTDDA
ncbi:MAG: hypothetical protein EP336_10405 [Rhodobacteraceae bacterium]|nr:MAG: hypothetical protein EP336_10405 [Paracoccaceae bacterium]